jgi:hypothetical protein
MEIGYNSQRDNFSFAGKFSAWSQCFSTCAWMLLSYYDKACRADDDKGLAQYVDDVEMRVGSPGIGERVMRKFAWITGFTSLWWLVHKEALEERLRAAGLKGSMVFRESDGTWEELYRQADKGPVIIGTSRLGGLPGGHIILAVRPGFYHDPFGNAMTGYADVNGANVNYPMERVRSAFEVAGAGRLRYLFWQNA